MPIDQSDMAISREEFQDMEVTAEREIRTDHSEQYTIYSNNLSAGKQIYDGIDIVRAGHLIIQYIPSTLSRTGLNATLILEAEWERKAIEKLYSDLDRRIISSFGVGSKFTRSVTNIDVFIVEKVLNEKKSEDLKERKGADGLRIQMMKIQNQIEDLPETINEVIAEHYNEIEEIIMRQDLDEEEKRRRVRDRLRVGLEMGLPTVMYEGSIEDR